MNEEIVKQIQKDNDVIRARAKLADDFKKLKSRVAHLVSILEVTASTLGDDPFLNALTESNEFIEIKELIK